MSFSSKLTALFLGSVMLAGSLNMYTAADNILSPELTELYTESESVAELNATAFKISNLEELESFRAGVNTGVLSGYDAVLTADIDISGAEWTPIGTKENPFMGNFDGAGHTVKGLTITKYREYAGFFGCTQNADISNLKITDANINISGGQGAVSAGILAGGVTAMTPSSNVRVDNVCVYGNVSVTLPADNVYASAICGRVNVDAGQKTAGTVKITNCNAVGDIKAVSSRKSALAGLITADLCSYSTRISTVENCAAFGNVYANAKTSAFSGIVAANIMSSGSEWLEENDGASLYDVTDTLVLNCVAGGSADSYGAVYSQAGVIEGSTNSYSDVGNCYYLDTSVLSARKPAGSSIREIEQYSGTKITAADIAKTSFLSGKVKLDTNNYWNVKYEMPCLKTFEPKTYTITVDTGDKGTSETYDFVEGTKVTGVVLPELSNNDDKKFVGWDGSIPLRMPSGNVTITAKWEVLEEIPGDIERDGEVNVKDLVKLTKYLAGFDVALTDTEKKLADVNGDGVVDSRDAVKIARYIAGKEIKLG